MVKCIHIFDFPNVSVRVYKTFLKEIKQKIKNKYKTQGKFYSNLDLEVSFTYFKNMLKFSNPYFIPVDILTKCCVCLDIPLSRMERNIISYRSSRGRINVKRPKLPIEISPLFYMTLAHIMADGNCIRIKNKTPYFGYVQYNRELLTLFINKVNSQFGKIDVNVAKSRVYLPSSLSMAMANKVDIKPEEFLSDRARIPKEWFNLKKDELFAVILAFIIDEGHVDSGQIVIGLHNEELLRDLKTICDRCNYKSSLKPRKLYILGEGVRELWKDYSNLKRKFPCVGLGYKEKQIEDFIIRKNKLWRSKSQGQTKNIIIKLIKEKPRTINELARILKISRQGVRSHIKKLYSLGIISKIGVAKDSAIIYKLRRMHKFEVKRKGVSRQKGVTKKKILEFLKEKPRTSVWLANELNIYKSTVMHFLHNLEKEGLISRYGKAKTRANPAILWKIEE
ncbi:MAG: ArsR family transcriptional regulator [Candidatus Woesearchaeota archaeon]|nr:MAG: ArsR family transcriptional regulator [Candidatus Woesearchaeota archaeon]